MKRRRTIWSSRIILLAWFLPLAMGFTATQTADGKVKEEIMQTPGGNTKPLAKKRPRLRFKSGPVCMCGTGLSEKEIRATEVKQFKGQQTNKSTSPINGAGGGEDDEQSNQ